MHAREARGLVWSPDTVDLSRASSRCGPFMQERASCSAHGQCMRGCVISELRDTHKRTCGEGLLGCCVSMPTQLCPRRRRNMAGNDVIPLFSTDTVTSGLAQLQGVCCSVVSGAHAGLEIT